MMINGKINNNNNNDNIWSKSRLLEKKRYKAVVP